MEKRNPTAFLLITVQLQNFIGIFLCSLEDVMHKSIATEHIKLQMKFIVKVECLLDWCQYLFHSETKTAV